MKASIIDPSAEFYFTAVGYNGQRGFNFRRAVMDEFRREGFYGQCVANTLKIKMREVTDDALEVLPHLLQSYLVPKVK